MSKKKKKLRRSTLGASTEAPSVLVPCQVLRLRGREQLYDQGRAVGRRATAAPTSAAPTREPMAGGGPWGEAAQPSWARLVFLFGGLSFCQRVCDGLRLRVVLFEVRKERIYNVFGVIARLLNTHGIQNLRGNKNSSKQDGESSE